MKQEERIKIVSKLESLGYVNIPIPKIDCDPCILPRVILLSPTDSICWIHKKHLHLLERGTK